MSYWSAKPDGNDFAFDTIAVHVLSIKDRMFEDMKAVIEDSHPEQSIVASLVCLRVIWEKFPQSFKIGFHRKHYQLAKKTFYEWLEKTAGSIPKKYRDTIVAEAELEFAAFETLIFKG